MDKKEHSLKMMRLAVWELNEYIATLPLSPEQFSKLLEYTVAIVGKSLDYGMEATLEEFGVKHGN